MFDDELFADVSLKLIALTIVDSYKTLEKGCKETWKSKLNHGSDEFFIQL